MSNEQLNQVLHITNDAHKILTDANWKYKGCGYWIDPKTKTKHMSHFAIKIQAERNNPSKKEN